jgi:SH3-like domain-containing protein
MTRLLLMLLLILPLACRENPSPESQAVTTDATTETTVTTATITETATGTIATETTATAPPPSSVKGPKLMPIDEATSDPSLVAFRNELLEAVRRRDADAVVALADPKIRTSFGGDGGAAAFKRSLAQPGTWEDFERLLTQGGKFVGEGPTRSFWAPYAFSALPDNQDAFMALVITGENVPLLESADKNARAIATLSHDIVQRTGDIGRDIGEWHNVKTADGRSGWVEARFVRSPVGYRAGFLKNKDGKWQINALVAGD